MVTHKQLANGVELNVLPSHQFKTTRVVINFIAPLAAETITQRSLLANLLETNSQDYPTQADLAAKLSAMYGADFGVTVGKQGNAHIFSMVLTVVNDRFLPGETHVLKDGLAFLKQILWRPNAAAGAFDAATFKREKANLAAYLQSVYDSKQAYASLQLQALYFQSSSAQRVPSFGNVKDLADITAVSLFNYYQQLLAHDQVMITVLGDVVPEQVVQEISQFPFAARQSAAYPIFYQQPKLTSVLEKNDYQVTNQAKLNLAYHAPVYFYQTDYYAMLLANAIFGASPLSLLFTNVRERASLAYYANSIYDGFRGLITVQTGIDASNYQRVKQIIAAQLAALKKGEFSTDLLTQTKAMLRNQYVSRLDSAGYLTHRALIEKLVPAAAVTNSAFATALEAVTKAEVVAAAQKINLQAVYFLSQQRGEQVCKK